MFRLQILQAEHGDCFILKYSTQSNPKYILIDGGPNIIYERYLRNELEKISSSGGKLDFVILSHIDNDHIIGLLDLFKELQEQRQKQEPDIINVVRLWYNSFSDTVGNDIDSEQIFTRTIRDFDDIGQEMPSMNMALEGFREGDRLTQIVRSLGIPINPEFDGALITVDNAPLPIVSENLNLYIIGPTLNILNQLRKEWDEWLDQFKESIESGDLFLIAKTDRSIPNLSSIMVLAEVEDKRVLLTGDGRGDHLLEGLISTGLLTSDEVLHVDVLKVPHHGSDRNVTRKFFRTVTADKYVISANGKYGNPDLSTLIWIVEAAKEQDREIEIIITNQTSSTIKIEEEYEPNEYGYKLIKMKKDQSCLTLDI